MDNLIVESRLENIRNRRQEIKDLLLKYAIEIPEENKNSRKCENKFKLEKINLKDIKVACVMDRFTLDSYVPECNLMELTSLNWKSEIDKFKPDLLFIESAWQGKDGSWYRKIANGSKEYFEMTSYCQKKDIPIVFWNKEDPVYTDTFMVTAKMADFVFTTDIDCIERYKKELKHENVYHLHFAAQPQIHNPIEKYNRKDKFCFAGAYYHRYPKRAEVFDKFSKVFIETKGFEIFDRNYKNSLPEHAFPNSYDKYILGKLDPSEIDIAYKGYNYGINMNSVNQSQTMFARRVFEMLASNTVTIGNYSRGIKNYFGDLTICTDDEITLHNELENYCSDKIKYRKYRLLGLRKVLSKHLYEDRLSYIVEKVFDKKLKKVLPKIVVISAAANDNELNKVVNMFSNQSYENKELYIISNTFKSVEENCNVITYEEAKSYNMNSLEANTYIATFEPNDYYGSNYLLDLALTKRYGDYKGIGKLSYYKYEENQYKINSLQDTYKLCTHLDSRRAIINTELIKNYSFLDLSKNIKIDNDNFFSIDEFNYCENYDDLSCDVVDDMVLNDQGIPVEKIECVAEGIKVNSLDLHSLILTGENLFKAVKSTYNVTFKLSKPNLIIESNLNVDKHEYIYFKDFYNINDYKNENKLNLKFAGIGNLDIICVCIFYDNQQKKISPVFTPCNRIFSAVIPTNAVSFKLGIRPKGNGTYNIDSIVIGNASNTNNKPCFLSRSNVLVLTNNYPKPGDLYKNMFVHKRMLTYKNDGYIYDIMRLNIYASDEYREYEGINIVEGQADILANILDKGYIETVCVHFLDIQMWSVLKNYLDKINIIIWSHGADIQPWWRRKYLFGTEEELNKAKHLTELKINLWNDVFEKSNNHNIHFVFVSQYAADIVMEDYKISIDCSKYSIIHNCIDTDLFQYIDKDPEQRKKIISIRPYASNIYANDIMAKTILELSKKEYFNDLEFMVIGEGELFDEITKPIKKFKNVIVRKEFLRQQDISNLYKEYGIVLIPTRGDTQGVSRDEAMSSGLVPITNSVAAIPEFVDETCGMLADNEDYMAMAEAIEKLYFNSSLYSKLSKNAAKRVRNQTSKKFTVEREIELIDIN